MYDLSTSSGQKTASAQISSSRGTLAGVDLNGPTTGGAILTIYDSSNSTTAGKLILCEVYCDAGMMSVNHEFTRPVAVNSGIYADLTYNGSGSGSNFIVRYSL